MRNVGPESRRTYQQKLASGFFDKFMSGSGLDIGPAGSDNSDSILPSAIAVEPDYPGYDGKHLPFPDNSQNYVYSSHCLEHITDWQTTIQEWHRVTKVGGHIVIIVPHAFLYEKKVGLPSRFNGDHKRFYTPCALLYEIEAALIPNTYRLRLCEDGDQGFNYSIPPEQHSDGQYEITVVLQKIAPPAWKIA